MGGRKSLLYGVTGSSLSSAGSRLKYIPGWGQRVIDGKAKVDAGLSYTGVSVVEMSKNEHRLAYEIQVTEKKMRQYFRDGFGFATARRYSSDLFLQVETQCMGYSKSDCLSFHLEFLSDVKIVN
jgi:hypothetical protein